MKRIINLLFLSVLTISFVSCLKDDLYKDRVIGHRVDNQKIIELVAANSSATSSALALAIRDVDTSIMLVPVRLASGMVADKDIVITLDTSYTSTYINDHIAATPALRYFSSAVGSLESGLTVTIPKGSNEGYIRVKTNSSKYDPALQYALAYRIASVSDPSYIVSGNFNTQVFLFSAKNRYDGVYTVEDGYIQRYTAPNTPESPSSLSGTLKGNPAVTLRTIDANTVEITGLTWFGGTSGIAGIDNLRATVDPATNQVTMRALGNASLVNIPGSINKYDPATRTFTLNFHWNPTANKREVTNLVLKYARVRN